MSRLFVASLFDQKPGQWGLRGDPYLWEEMRSKFIAVPLPESAEVLEALLAKAFETLTSYPLTADQKIIAIERLAHGGMSSGGVSIPFWRETAIPLLVSYQPLKRVGFLVRPA